MTISFKHLFYEQCALGILNKFSNLFLNLKVYLIKDVEIEAQ